MVHSTLSLRLVNVSKPIRTPISDMAASVRRQIRQDRIIYFHVQYRTGDKIARLMGRFECWESANRFCKAMQELPEDRGRHCRCCGGACRVLGRWPKRSIERFLG